MRMSLNHVRLRGKMILVYLLSVFVPIVLTNLVFFQVTTHHVRQQKLRDMSMAMAQIKSDFLNQIDVAVGVSSVLYTDSLLNEAIEKKYASAAEYVDSYYANVSPTLYRYSPIYKAIQDISIYTDNPTIIGGGGVLPLDSSVRRQAWFREFEQAGGQMPIVVRNTIETYKGAEITFSVVRNLDYFQYQNLRQKNIL